MFLLRLVLLYAVFQLVVGILFALRPQHIHSWWLDKRTRHPILMLVFFKTTRYSQCSIASFRTDGILMVITSGLIILLLWGLRAIR